MASLQPLSGTLGRRRAAHLLRRTSYRYTRAAVDQMSGKTAAQVLDALLMLYPQTQDQPYYDDPTTASDIEKTPWILPPGLPLPPNTQDFMLRRPLIAWWLNEAFNDPGIGHKMQFFFHQYNIVAANTRTSAVFFDYLALLRWGALGNFKKLASKIIWDNDMLAYLNNNENTANNPNENFAREFFELFTIGKGPQVAPGDYTNYTEDDIVQAARVLTGLRTIGNRTNIDPETGIPRGGLNINQHDKGPKTFSAKFQGKTIAGGNNAAGVDAELAAFVDMIFAQPETARTTVRRLYRYFVNRNITSEIENDIIEPLAVIFRNSDYQMMPVLRALFESQHFYDADDSVNTDEIVGGMIKSPLELSMQAMSFFNLPIPDPNTNAQTFYNRFWSQTVLDRMLGGAGMPVFQPSDVAGYPGFYQEPEYSRQWFNSSTIIARYKLPAMLLTGTYQIGSNPNASIGTKLNIAPWVRNSGAISNPSNPQTLVQELLWYMLPEEVDNDRFNYFYYTVFLDNLPPADWTYEWQNYLTTNDATEVTIALQRLVSAIMYSPEYQTF
ncbi:MAG: DUF1800 family protein [Saprospiraceae bacterium]